MTSPLTPQSGGGRRARRSLHALLLRRIGVTALLISAVLVASVYMVEQRHLGAVVADLAMQRAAQFAALAGDALAAPGGARRSEVQARLDRFIQGRLAPREGRIIAASIRAADDSELAAFEHPGHPQAGAVRAFLKAQAAPGAGDAESARAVDIGGLRHFLVQIPLGAGDGATLGSLSAIFAPSDAYLADLRARLWGTLVAAIGIVLVTAAILYPVIWRLMQRVSRLSDELLEANLEMLSVIGSAIAKRDADTDAHNYRVTIYSVRLAEALGLDTRTMQALIKGAFMHDVGKIGIPDQILLKPGRLDDAEFAQMQEHVHHGLDIVGRAAWLSDAAAVVGGHHERYDGGGYSNGLRGEAIPLIARVFAIADVFDALTSRRPYKEPLPFEAAMAILAKGRGSHFDPRLLDAFTGIARGLYDGFANRDDGRPRQVLREILTRYFEQDPVALP